MAKYAAVAAAGKLADKQVSILRQAIEQRLKGGSEHDKGQSKPTNKQHK
jgi:hypothetical protein